MPRWTLLAIALAPGCIVFGDPDPIEPDHDPVRTECDVDGDGVLSLACGGADCDDLDASVRPGADEWFGDGIDQDCDGAVDVQTDRFPLPSRTRALSWEWRSDLRNLGGVLVQPTGDAVAQDLDLDPAFGGPVRLKRRSTYETPLGELHAERISTANGLLDLLADERGLAAWEPTGSVGTLRWRRDDLRIGPFHLAHHADTPDAAWLLSCDGDGLDLAEIDLIDGRSRSTAHLDTVASSCALLGHRDGSPVVMVSDGSTLERWVLKGDTFVDRLVLSRGVATDDIRSVGDASAGVLAFVDEGVLTIIDRDGRGLRLGAGEATDVFDVALTDQGEVAVAWVGADGIGWLGLGPIAGPLDALPVATGLGQAHPIAVGARPDELSVAIQDDDELVLLRARR